MQLINSKFHRPLGAELVMQPLSTIVDGMHTRIDFSRGSRRLLVQDRKHEVLHPVEDRGHMNDEFGKLWLELFFKEYLGLSLDGKNQAARAA